MKKTKQGISLIILVVMIIIIIILSGAIILNLDGSAILNRADEVVLKVNEDEIQELINTAWLDAYMQGAKTEEEYEIKIVDYLKNNGVDEDYLQANSLIVTDEGAYIIQSIVDTVDGVPIPKGFVASNVTGENTKVDGLVIYEGESAVNDENVTTARLTREQYVWVPVDSFSMFKRNTHTMAYTLKEKLGSLNDTCSDVNNCSAAEQIGFWEVELDANNLPLDTQSDMSYMTEKTLNEAKAMYGSVEKYGGFYLARYEAGLDAQRTAEDSKLEYDIYSVMGKIPYTYISWGASMTNDSGGAIEVARSRYPKNNISYGAVSTLTYGVQWDVVLQWLKNTGKISDLTNSITYGNHIDHEIASADALTTGALVWDTTKENSLFVAKDSETLTYPKSSTTAWTLSTGALKAANINNIYDLAGNVYEWTMEGYSTKYHVSRGGSYNFPGNAWYGPLASRASYEPNTRDENIGFRIALYIK